MLWTDDPVRDWDRYCEAQDEWLATRPVCDQCKTAIQDDFYYNIMGEKWCAQCVEDTKEYID